MLLLHMSSGHDPSAKVCFSNISIQSGHKDISQLGNIGVSNEMPRVCLGENCCICLARGRELFLEFLLTWHMGENKRLHISDPRGLRVGMDLGDDAVNASACNSSLGLETRVFGAVFDQFFDWNMLPKGD